MLFRHEPLPPKAAKIGTLCITPGFQAHLRRRGHWYTAIGHEQPGGRRYDHQHCSEVSDGGRLPRDDRHHPGGNAQAPRRTVTVTHAPIVSPGDVSESWSARQNVIDSKQYERKLATNPAFRQARMRKECGPITDPELRQGCLASFDQR
jgi:hypothetical protein